jgi:O-antigen/teichoic acid export membrane protein
MSITVNEIKSKVSRTQNTTLNSFFTVLFKLGSILLSFAIVPMTLKLINSNTYGIWLTLSSIVGWFAIFDVGIANGLKNNLTKCISENNYDKGRYLISTTYLLMLITIFITGIIFIVLNYVIDWQIVLNTTQFSEKYLKSTILAVALCFLIKFFLDIINVINAAFQIVAINSLLMFISNLSIAISLWCLIILKLNDFFVFSLIISIIPLLISLLASIYLFRSKYRLLMPSLRKIDFSQSREILTLGLNFFILQIVVLVIFQSDNIIIAQFFSTAEVAKFNVTFKYYSTVSVIFSTLVSPYWTAFTDAYHLKDFSWISKTINKLVNICLFGGVISILLILFSDLVFKYWIGKHFSVSTKLSLSICLYIFVMNLSSIFAIFLNGIGKIRVQIIISPIVGFLNIALSLFFIKVLDWNVISVPIANFLSLAFGVFFGYFQYRKVIEQKASGIWDK